MRRASVLLLLVGTAATSTSEATPLLAPRPGGAVFTGPTSAHVSSLLHNPAAIGLMSGTHILILGTGQLDTLSISRDDIRGSDGEPTAPTDHTFGGQTAFALTPGGFIGLSSDLGTEDLTLGLGVYLPFAEHVPDLDPSLGYQSLGGALTTASLTVAVAYRVSGSFYGGIAFDFSVSKLHLTFLRDRALDGCTAPPCDVENSARAERWNVETNWDALPGVSFEPTLAVNFGAMLLWRGWWIGAAVDFLPPLKVSKTAQVTVTPPDGVALEGKARVSYRLPVSVQLGVRRPVLRTWDLILNGSWTETSVHDLIDIQLFQSLAAEIPEWVTRHRGFADVFGFEAGLEQPPATRLRLGARARVETSVVPAGKVNAGAIDGPKLEISGSAELRLSTRVALIAGYSLALVLPVKNDPGDYSPGAAIDCAASGYDLTTEACRAVREGRGISSAAGSYSRIGNTLSLGISYDAW